MFPGEVIMMNLAVGVLIFILSVSSQAVGVQPKKAASASNQFAFALYQNISKTEGNLFFSPFSIETALAMTSVGARAETFQQMQKVLKTASVSHEDFKSLLALTKGNESYQLFVANRIWGQQGLEYFPEFQKILSQNFGAELAPLDFKSKAEESRQVINKWVEEQTKDKIKDLLKPGMIDKETDMVLTNAIYFKGSWMNAFKKEATKNEAFFVTETTKKEMPFMHLRKNFRYEEKPNFQSLQMEYKGEDLVMDVILPKKGIPLSKVEKDLTALAYSELGSAAVGTDIQLTFPKFKAESDFDLGESLAKMGMPLAFDKAKANFKGIRYLQKDENMSISKVVHKAFVDMNEEGTEAAAATAVAMMVPASVPAPPVEFKANRPFLYFIRHVRTGAILFMGRYSKP
jgi:serpin B